MNEDLNTTFVLMGVGMITVFIVLLGVVIIGNVLISFVNRYIPLVETKNSPSQSTSSIASVKIAAITTAVEVFTKGKGEITNIKKLNN
jgi:oxaloacetate decarboxylase gamma subunit